MKKLLLFVLFPVTAWAQVATGDARTVTEPTFPATCTKVQATKYIVSTTAVNIDPYNPTCGSISGANGTLGCTGGTSFEPSSTSGSYTAAETLDNTAVQNALNSCTSGQAVELVPGASGQTGFVMSPFNIPTGVTLLVDAGITVFASRNVNDFAQTNCGIVTTGSSSCVHWITSLNTTGSGVMGYGVLDGRGWDAYIGQTTSGFYANRVQAYCNNHGGAINGSPNCTVNSSGNNSYGPNMFDLSGSNSFTLYKITLKDAGNFFINWKNANGFTAWDAKIVGPFEVPNTDGWDPLNSNNGTWTKGYISNGDNMTALKSTSGAVSNITVSYTQTGAGIGLALGSATQFGTSNVLFDHIVQNGNLNDVESTGLQIASSSYNGGSVDRVTYQNVCMVNESRSIRMYSNYGGQSGTNNPRYTNLIFRNIHILPSTAPYTTGNSGYFTFAGFSATNTMTLTLDNLVIDGVNQGIQSQSGITDDRYTVATLGPGAVASSVISQIQAGTGSSTTGTPGTSVPYACTTSSWKPLIGELLLKTSTLTNLQTYTTPPGTGTYTLQATLIPATAVSSKESPAPTGSVTFYDNGTPVGTAALSSNGTMASLALSGVPAGTHNYTAGYSDANYSSFTFGAVTATVPGGTIAATVRGNTKVRGTDTTH